MILQRLERVHEEHSIKGSEAEISGLTKRLEELGITGILVGGCLDSSKQFPRKDIDIVVPEGTTFPELEGYDLWYHRGDATYTVNGAVRYNNLRALVLALGNLPAGLYVMEEIYPNIKRGLPVTRYVSLNDLIDKNTGDTFSYYRGQPLMFRVEDRFYIGRLVQSDAFFVEFDDVVCLNTDEENRSPDESYKLLENILHEELSELRNRIRKYIEENIPLKDREIDYCDLFDTDYRIDSSNKDWDLTHRRVTSTGIDFISYTKKEKSNIKLRILQTIRQQVTDRGGYTSIVDDLMKYAEKSIAGFLGAYGLSVNEKEDEQFDKGFQMGVSTVFDLYLEEYSVRKKITFRMINVGPENEHFIALEDENINRLWLEIQNSVTLLRDSPDIFQQYRLALQKELLALFVGYRGSVGFAKHTILAYSNSHPLMVPSDRD